jgi:acetyl-CoA carboxylase biotin carboxylase subunit
LLTKILVANRGEIAIRVMRACRELGISSVAVYSEADKDALHVQMADEAVAIGPASARQSYLSIPAIVEAASRVHADAVHPGYGFLAENPALAEVLAVWGITFIGPKAESIRAMGLKTTAKETMRRAGVPLAPGSVGAISELQEAQREAERIGYPVMVKAVAGGGGRGIRVARQAADLPDALERAASEAKSSFGDGAVFLEKYVEDPRHIEVQVMADGQGGYLALGERECSLQRRRQKLVEEAPSVAITPTQRQAVSEAAIRAAEAVDYIGAGTVEFLLDPQTGEFYFMEMNTRIQVEHGVTELVTGEDLVKSQIQVASGEALARTGWETQMVGWAMECRINAEDPDQDFRPSPGTISRFQPPGFAGVRVDAGVTAGSAITPYYDSLVAKLMTWGRDRTEAISRMRSALSEFRVEGIATTIPIHQKIMADPDFIKGAIHTNFLERRFPGA